MGARLINGRKKKKRLAHRKSRLKAALQAQGNVDAGSAQRKR
jgi:hypothetical protein